MNQALMDQALLDLSVFRVRSLVNNGFRSHIDIENCNELHRLFDPRSFESGKRIKCLAKEKDLDRHARTNMIVLILVEAGVDPGLRRIVDNVTPMHLAVRRNFIAPYTILKMISSARSSLGFGKEFRSAYQNKLPLTDWKEKEKRKEIMDSPLLAREIACRMLQGIPRPQYDPALLDDTSDEFSDEEEASDDEVNSEISTRASGVKQVKEVDEPDQEDGEPDRKRPKASLCSICVDNGINILIRPCSHACLCDSCSVNRLLKNCPVCRCPIEKMEKFFLC